MSRLLGVLLLLVVGIAGLGFYLGWFHVSTSQADQKTNITVTVDQDKIQEDKEKAKDKVQEFGRNLKEKAGSATTGKTEGERQP
jgi:hypothetical protein